MPIAAIENGTLPQQRTVVSRLDKMGHEFKRQNVKPPVIIMVGPTIALRDEISWFENKLASDFNLPLQKTFEKILNESKINYEEDEKVLNNFKYDKHSN